MNANFYHSLKEQFSHQLNKCAIESVAYPNYSLTYEQLDHRTHDLAAVLIHQGIKPQDRVLVQIDKSVNNLVLYLACLRMGAIYLPLNTGYKQHELSYFIEDAKPSLIVCTAASLSLFQALAPSTLILTLEQNNQGSLIETASLETTSLETTLLENTKTLMPTTTVVDYRAHRDDPAVIIYTSGTTGKPKGAVLTHNNLMANAIALKQVWNISDKDIVLHVLPLFHIHGLFVATHSALLANATIKLLEHSDNDHIISQLACATIFMGVPTHYTRMLAHHGLNKSVCHNIRLFISGSAPLLSTTFEQFQQQTGHTILERYGMSETGINSSNPLIGDRKISTVGLPVPGVSVRVVDDDDQVIDALQIGHIQVQGPNVFAGYWQNSEKTKQAFSDDGYFKTGDLGFFDQQGYLSISGRSKDLIISGGYNVYPKEIEQCLDKASNVGESAVIGLAHDDFGEAVTAVLVLKDAHIPIDEAQLNSYLKTHLATYKIPKSYCIVGQLPRNTMGKVQKNKLREQFKNLYQKANTKST